MEDVPKHSFLKSSVFLIIFFVLTPVALGFSAFALMTVSEKKTIKNHDQVLAAQISGVDVPRYTNIFSPANEAIPSVSATTEVADARLEIVRQYLSYYKSPLEPYAEVLVREADNNQLDFRLTTAIAQQESNLCKIIPPDTHNCWGWGIHSQGTLGFTSYEEGIMTVSQGLKKNYIDKGFKTPEEIMSKYTPSSNGSWAHGVTQFMNEMK